MTKVQRPIGSAWAYLDRNRPRRAVFYGRVSMHLYSSGNNDILINMMSVGANTTVDFIQPFENTCYVDAFQALLADARVDFTVSERIRFNTPRDGIAETPAVEQVRKHHNLLKAYIDSLN